MITKTARWKAIWGKNLFHHWSEQTQLKCEKHEVLWSWTEQELFSFLKWWLDELLPPKFQWSLETQYPLQHQLQAKEKVLADLTSIINIHFYLATAGATVVCRLHFPCGEYFLWRKQGWQAPHIHLLIHLLIHFPLKREKKIHRVLNWLLSNLNWNNELNNWHQFIVTVQFFFSF